MTDLHYDERLNILGLMRLDKRRDNWVHNRSFDYPSILLAITSLLTANSYFIVIALDFSKAFDTVRHSAVLQKLAQLDIPDHIFNWISDYLQDHSHCIVQQLFIGFANCLCQYNPGVWCRAITVCCGSF